MENPISILVLSGLPGAGKTTFVESLLFECRKTDTYHDLLGTLQTESTTALPLAKEWGYKIQPEILCLFCKHVSYDALIPANIYTESNEDTSLWKLYRRNVLCCVENDLQWILEKPVAVEPDNEFFKSDNHQEYLIRSRVLESYQKLEWTKCNDGQGRNTLFLFIIDDNMFYPSMRHEYYQIAQKYNIGFCQVHISCSVSDAQRRNVKRAAPVSMETIATMATKIVPPDNSNKWEKYALIMSAERSCDLANLTATLDLVLTSVGDPVEPIQEVDKGAIEAERQICSESLLHQADQILRKLIGQAMSDTGKDSPKVERQRKAAELNSTRKLILEELKLGSIEISADMASSIIDSSKDLNSPFCLLIEKSFKEKLK